MFLCPPPKHFYVHTTITVPPLTLVIRLFFSLDNISTVAYRAMRSRGRLGSCSGCRLTGTYPLGRKVGISSTCRRARRSGLHFSGKPVIRPCGRTISKQPYFQYRKILDERIAI